MDTIELLVPTYEYKVQMESYKKEFIENNDSLCGSGGYGNIDKFEDWLEHIKNCSSDETVPENLVPSTTYIAVRKSDGRVVGMIDLRHRLNDYLLKFGGNIGYCVRKSERRKGYAKEMLQLAILKYKNMGTDKVLITCDHNNIASAKTIEANDGILENEIQNGDTLTKRYWINV
ncbi:MAG: GNAT family N-acetyltransferase [Oscillospiraceae bacterium]